MGGADGWKVIVNHHEHSNYMMKDGTLSDKVKKAHEEAFIGDCLFIFGVRS
jgi:hypothetical protein